MKSWHGFIKLATASTYKLRQKVNYGSFKSVGNGLTNKKKLSFSIMLKNQVPKNQTKHYQIPMIRVVASKDLTLAMQQEQAIVVW